MTELKPYQWLDANQLKLIAIVAMTVDHIAWLLVPGVCRRGGTYCDAYYWADHLPSHVLFHCGGLPLYP